MQETTIWSEVTKFILSYELPCDKGTLALFSSHLPCISINGRWCTLSELTRGPNLMSSPTLMAMITPNQTAIKLGSKVLLLQAHSMREDRLNLPITGWEDYASYRVAKCNVLRFSKTYFMKTIGWVWMTRKIPKARSRSLGRGPAPQANRPVDHKAVHMHLIRLAESYSSVLTPHE